MPPKKPSLGQPVEVANDLSDKLRLIDEHNAEQSDLTRSARELAAQLSYDGDLTVGALEDGIRFYQRRTVEACLELGKRLLVLKELTPHGEFEQRLTLLGFAERTAQRFMQAAAKTSKSAKLADLSGQVKSVNAFLELVTHDDDVLENLSEMDEIGRMSASELRALARNLKADAEAKDRVLEGKDKKINELSMKASKKIVITTDWSEELKHMVEQVAGAGRDIVKAIDLLENCRIRVFEELGNASEDEKPRLEEAVKHLASVYANALHNGRRKFDKEVQTFSNTLGAFVETDE